MEREIREETYKTYSKLIINSKNHQYIKETYRQFIEDKQIEIDFDNDEEIHIVYVDLSGAWRN